MNQNITLATLAALVTCFLAILVAVSLNPALVDKMTALGAGVVLGGLLGFLSNGGSPNVKPPVSLLPDQTKE